MISEFTVRKALWPEDSELVRRVRETVFVFEQGVDSKIEWDGRDGQCQHAIALSSADESIGTGRILPNGHIGRIAVLPSWRGRGIGSAILENLIHLAKDKGAKKVYLNSQTHAIAFYKHFNFEAEGPVFMEAGIPHQRMSLVFN